MCDLINPNSIGVKYHINSIRGGNFYNVSVLTYLLVKFFFFFFKLNLQVNIKAKAVSNRDICFIKAVLLWCKLRHLNFTSHGLTCHPPKKNTTRVKILHSSPLRKILSTRQIILLVSLQIFQITKCLHPKSCRNFGGGHFFTRNKNFIITCICLLYSKMYLF